MARSYLKADYQIACDGDAYGGQVAYAVIMIFIFPIGIPCVFFLLLFNARQEIMNLPQDIKSDKKLNKLLSDQARPLKFLFSSYVPSAWYAEVVECTRRLALDGAVAVVASSNGPAVGAFIGLCLSGGYASMWREQMAFKQMSTNALAFGCQYQMFFTFMMAFILVWRGWTPTYWGAVFVSTVLTLLTFVVLGVGAHQQYKQGLIEKAIQEEKEKLLAENKRLANEMEEFRKTASGIVAVKQSMSLGMRRRFLFEDWASPPADMTPEERIAAGKVESPGLLWLFA